jgi:general secretion pathway protein D
VSVSSDGADINLNFEEIDIREVVKLILGELLGRTYVVDPAVAGTVTMHNEAPVSRDALLPVLEVLLQMNGAALVEMDGGYRVVPLAKAPRAMRRPVTDGRVRPGYVMRVIPLRFASAEEVHKILEPYVPEGGTLTPVPQRNILILAAPGSTVREFLATVRVFDADWLAGMSMGLISLAYASAGQVTEELGAILGEAGSPMSGVVRIFPIERLNAVLVVTPQERYLDEIEGWVRQLDRGGDTAGRRVYIYEVRNGRAEKMAAVLNEVFASQSERDAPPPPSLAPGLQPASIGSPQDALAQGAAAGAPPAPAGAPLAAVGTPSTETVDLGDINIIADADNNTLLVLATRAEYAAVENVIKRLDILPRQVLVEATIAEVTLTDNLQYGLQWFLKGSIGRFDFQVRSTTGDSARLPVASAPGLSAAVFKSPADVRVFIDALETESQLRVLSSPQILVTDNKTANIRVGTQVPITTRQSTSADTGDALVQEIEYRDTGVLLTVTPRINSGGIVTLDVSQEVSVVGPPVGPSGNVSVDQRSIDSSISIQGGETVVLGGLITERNTRGTTGIPVLSKIPVLGALFGSTSDDTSRTELIVLITPSVITTTEEAAAVTRELRERLSGVPQRPK